MLNALRRHRRPVSGRALADEMGVSLRTLYRDIASLQAQGATIEGEPGVGYILRPGFLLPPMMFTPEEIEALVLGSRWVADRAVARMRDAALSALARIGAVVPPDLRDEMEAEALLVPSGSLLAPGHDLAQLIDTALGERQPARYLLALSRVLLFPPFQPRLSLPVELGRPIARSECLVQLGDEGIPCLRRFRKLSG